jgi:hypothetical protein
MPDTNVTIREVTPGPLRLQGKTVQYKELRDCALNESPFTKPRAMLKELELKTLISVYSNDQKRRKGTFNEDKIDGPMPNLDLAGIDWVIVGGESGPGARPMDPAWVLDIRDQCQEAGVPFFFKQWGGVQKKKAGRELDGRTWDEIPRVMRQGEKIIGLSSRAL